jgi:hypothetical protein
MLRYNVELFHDCATFLIHHEKYDDACVVLKKGLADNPSSLLLSFCLAEILESRKVDFGEISALFDSLINNIQVCFFILSCCS